MKVNHAVARIDCAVVMSLFVQLIAIGLPLHSLSGQSGQAIALAAVTTDN